MKLNRNIWYRIALVLILAAAGFLSFYGVWNEGYANSYYSAAVKSMLTSWHNFFFVSLDPGGFVSVDKPALGLWLQALSAYIFGFHGWSLILPQALATVLSVAVLYHLVQRTFGKAAGLLSALALAFTPILEAVSRTNNLDATLVMLLLFAAWALTVAAERSSVKLLLLSMALVGLGFNVKMLEAFMVLPAFYLVYFLTSSLKTGKKILHLTAATVLLLAVSLSWAVIVDLTPADQRPYVGSSRTNSVLELALGYNGIQRVVPNGSAMGMGTPDGGGNGRDRLDFENSSSRAGGEDDAAGSAAWGNDMQGNASQPNGQVPPDGDAQGGDMRPDGQFPDGGGSLPEGMDGRDGANMPDGGGRSPGGFGGPGGTGENGTQGVFRIFNRQLAGQISWLIPLALLGLLTASLRARRRAITGKRAARRSLLLWGAWIAPMFVYFSIAGFFHRYYLSMLAPGIAALAGIGVVEMGRAYGEKGRKGFMLPAALVANAALQGLMLSRYPQWGKILIPVVCGMSTASALALIGLRIFKKGGLKKSARILAAAGFAALLIAPALWSYTPIMYGSQTTLPYAGPELASGGFGGGGNQGRGGMNPSPENAQTSALIDFLLRNKQDEKYLVAVSNATTAAPIILETGQPVMAVGGFLGSDPILTADKLEKMVQNGEIRYFQVSGMGNSQSEITRWVMEHGTVVSSDQWTNTASEADRTDRQDGFGQPDGRMGNGTVLYDLAPEKGTK
ncbi:MAG: glycosyltransferase family 39 protein [Clostridiales bacterium]|jgi:4-amino-4-deoxy-L-arabinose transferase-like glycosyltransferase|nr:glycosyltransferase family 39 protein [Eubacteriales bacterium]MDH7567711.1 glycosyltransferase family 39 protein [Clostridiales bacterium]